MLARAGFGLGLGTKSLVEQQKTGMKAFSDSESDTTFVFARAGWRLDLVTDSVADP